jgi:predicted TIM-barrel fold metal-dependent hydrolase
MRVKRSPRPFPDCLRGCSFDADLVQVVLKNAGGFQCGRSPRLVATSRSIRTKRPTEYFKTNCYVAFRGDEPTMKSTLDLVGDDNFLWDTDYPHPDGTFPWGIDAILKQSIPHSSKRKILWDNPARAFGLN